MSGCRPAQFWSSDNQMCGAVDYLSKKELAKVVCGTLNVML